MKERKHKVYLSIKTKNGNAVHLNIDRFSKDIISVLPNNREVTEIVFSFIQVPIIERFPPTVQNKDLFNQIEREVKRKVNSCVLLNSFDFLIPEVGIIYRVIK